SNYVYGTGKGALSIFLQGLRNRLHAAGVQVLTIKPGFVATQMTSHLKQGPLFASPETIAPRIVKAIDSGEEVLYVPWFWRVILGIFCAIPEKIFKKTSL
ncbi:MAG: SDR family NAD(P)-dependent oxidoreductase, partial [Bdellovibrionales bacterium]|nr:SDR family NAD(P)-dependent oxidoreductase [Bdellovibrionales bacterium]